MPLLQAFNASDRKWSPYASMVQLELLQASNSTNTDYAVRLLYHGQERRIPYCDSSPCSLAQFSEYIRAITPQDPDVECKVTKPEIMTGPSPPRLGRTRVLFWDETRPNTWGTNNHLDPCLILELKSEMAFSNKQDINSICNV